MRIPDEILDFIMLRESFKKFVFVMMDANVEIRSYADIDCATIAASEDVDSGLFFFFHL